MKRIVLILMIGSALFLPSLAAPRPFVFSELWNNAAYYQTNLEKKNFTAFLGRYEGKFGLNLFDLPWQAYLVYYGSVSQNADYWNNSFFYGVGSRYKPFESYKAGSWQDEWIKDVKVYVESLQPTYWQGAASAESAGLATTDLRYGLEVWHEWNLDNVNENLPWGELWTNFAWRTTNFGWEDFNSYIFYFQPKFGRHLGNGIEAYLKADLTISGKSGASYSFLNTAAYGVGIRVEPWRMSGQANDLFKKFKMYAEILGVSYLKDQPTDPNKVVSSDVRFGIDFSYGR